MNKYLMICLALFTASSFCQKNIAVQPTYCPETPVRPYTFNGNDDIFSLSTLDVKPEFPNGMDSFYKAFHAEFKLATESSDLKGRFFITFIIEKDGSLSNINVLRDLGSNTGEEAVRVIKKMPKWKPGQYQEKPVRCNFTVPIRIPYDPTPTTSHLKIKEILDKH